MPNPSNFVLRFQPLLEAFGSSRGCRTCVPRTAELILLPDVSQKSTTPRSASAPRPMPGNLSREIWFVGFAKSFAQNTQHIPQKEKPRGAASTADAACHSDPLWDNGNMCWTEPNSPAACVSVSTNQTVSGVPLGVWTSRIHPRQPTFGSSCFFRMSFLLLATIAWR